MWSKLLIKKKEPRGKEKEESASAAAAAGPASGHEVDGHRRSASTCSGATAAEANGPEADVGHRLRRGAELGGGQAAGPHGRRPARARGRAVVVRAGVVAVVGEVQRRGGRGGGSVAGRRSWSRRGAAVAGGGGGAPEEEERGGGGGAPQPAAPPLLLMFLQVVVLLGDGLLELEPCGLQRRRLVGVVAPAPLRLTLRPRETAESVSTFARIGHSFRIWRKPLKHHASTWAKKPTSCGSKP